MFFVLPIQIKNTGGQNPLEERRIADLLLGEQRAVQRAVGQRAASRTSARGARIAQ